MINKNNWVRLVGFILVVAICVFLVIFSNENYFLERIQPYLFDYGVNSLCSCITVALFYGCMRQEGSGTKIFRVLIFIVSLSFLINEMMLFTMNVPEWKTICFALCMIGKSVDLALIFLFYHYIKRLLDFNEQLVRVTDIVLPILLVLQSLLLLSNLFYPVTFSLTDQGAYSYTQINFLEDIFLAVTVITTLVHIVLSRGPIGQKVATLAFIIFPVVGYLLIGGEFGSASQYGFVLVSLIVMYCVIFNDKSKALMATEAELNMASEIQTDVLPSVVPDFENRTEFDIYASMNPAKEVGGDFYDFFMIDDDHLAMVIADVSGKGVPAALFMMSSKILINDHSLIGGKPSEILERVNKAVYAKNKAHMFVTVWLGILEISTGKLITSNAGHEYPIINIHGRYELFKDKHGLAIGAMPSSKYTDTEITLKSGDQIFVYTDGVAEATDFNKQMFGTDRTVEALNALSKDASQKEVLNNVKVAVDAFVKDAPQFDDITMLGLKYIGKNSETKKNIKELVIEAKRENLNEVQSFIDEELEKINCPMKTQISIGVAVEEIFVNIANYAYEGKEGDATIQVSTSKNPLSIEITFVDSGIPYNPLEKPDPNTSLSLMERKKGGLGIFMVKKSMDDMTYEYKDGKNILKIIKNI